jgi:sucrose phosphorylase
LNRPVVQALLDLLRLRNRHPAFAGTCECVTSAPDQLTIVWTGGNAFSRLDVDLARMRAAVTCSGAATSSDGAIRWKTW